MRESGCFNELCPGRYIAKPNRGWDYQREVWAYKGVKILERYHLKLPESVMNLLKRGLKGELEETPKGGDPIFDKTFPLIIGSNIIALKAAEQKAKALGYTTFGIAGMDGTVILSCGTDGTDGPTDATGALADGFTIQRAERLGMHPQDYLRNNDSYHFFEKLDDLIKTGPTNTNVMDVSYKIFLQNPN